jgi:DedD protein
MGLLSIFKRQADNQNGAGAAGPAPDDVQRARTRARQRLIGAVVLVGIGIVGFPLVFETQPRPIPVDIPIELPRKDGAPSLVMPAARTPGATSSTPAAQIQPAAPVTSASPQPAAPNDVITEAPEEASREATARSQGGAASSSAPVARAASRPAAKLAGAEPAKPYVDAKPATETKPAAVEAKPATTVAESTRAKSLLEGKPAASGEAGRFVVQVGAFADAGAARETRLKAEKLGIKTYTQVVSTSSGSRIRVRLGPFANRDEADSAMSKARGAGLTAVVLTL